MSKTGRRGLPSGLALCMALTHAGLAACGDGSDVAQPEVAAPAAPGTPRRSSEALCQQVNDLRVAWLTEERDRLLEQQRKAPTDEQGRALSRVGFQRSMQQDEGVADCTHHMSEEQARCILGTTSPEAAARCPQPDVRSPEERPDAALCERLAQHLVHLMTPGPAPTTQTEAVRAFVQKQQQDCLDGMTRTEVACQLEVEALRGGGLVRCLR